ncbi:unnamed protein product [Arctogadus glacialis]
MSTCSNHWHTDWVMASDECATLVFGCERSSDMAPAPSLDPRLAPEPAPATHRVAPHWSTTEEPYLFQLTAPPHPDRTTTQFHTPIPSVCMTVGPCSEGPYTDGPVGTLRSGGCSHSHRRCCTIA